VGIIFTVEYEEDTNCLKCGFFFLLAVARICLAVLKIALLCGIWWWGGGGGGGGIFQSFFLLFFLDLGLCLCVCVCLGI
jgi:hypothetical protein